MLEFRNYHPIVIFAYFILMVITSFMSMEPGILIISLVGAVIFRCADNGVNINKSVFYFIMLFLIITVSNPIFSHNGETVLFYINNFAITRESILYGMSAAVMIIAVILWSMSLSDVMSMDKFLYLTGKVMPKLSLILCMSVRFIPFYKRHAREVSDVQKAAGIYSDMDIITRIKGRLRIYDSVLGWGIENSVETADSMKARGYGSGKYTPYVKYRFKKSDMVALIVIIIYCIVLAYFTVIGDLKFSYYPVIDDIGLKSNKVIFYLSEFLFALFPLQINIRSGGKAWNYLK